MSEVPLYFESNFREGSALSLDDGHLNATSPCILRGRDHFNTTNEIEGGGRSMTSVCVLPLADLSSSKPPSDQPCFLTHGFSCLR